jgi:hypothetical protein
MEKGLSRTDNHYREVTAALVDDLVPLQTDVISIDLG